MQDAIVENILSQVEITFDPALLITLLMLGALIKHSKATVKIDNAFIPWILLVVSVGYTILKLPTFNRLLIVDALASAIVNAGLAIAIHSTGKSALNYVNAKKVLTALADTIEEVAEESDDPEKVPDAEELKSEHAVEDTDKAVGDNMNDENESLAIPEDSACTVNTEYSETNNDAITTVSEDNTPVEY